MIHVLSDALLRSGGLASPPHADVWFFEGLAEALSGGTAAGAINGRDHLHALTSEYGELNPVSYRSDETVEGGVNAYVEYHYPVRQLAVEYLLASDGLGRTPSDATALFLLMSEGVGFDRAFEQSMGISRVEYEASFFDLVDDYLPARSTAIVFAPIGLLIVLVITIGLAATLSVRSIRRSLVPGDGETVPGDQHRRGTIRFAIWIAAAAAVSLYVHVTGVQLVGRSWTLTDAEKSLGVGILVGQLAVSAIAVTWAARQARSRSWWAWLIPVVALAAPVVAVLGLLNL